MRKTILFSALFALIIVAIGGIYMYQVLTVETEVIDEQIFDMMDAISIHTVTIDVEIEASKDASVKVELIGNKKQKSKPKLLTSTSEGQLKIDVQESQKSTWINASLSPGANKLKISVPEQLLQTLESKSDTGNIMIEGVKAEQFLIQNNVGNVRIHHTSGAYTIETITGTIQMELDNIERPLNINTDIGDIKIQTKEKPSDAVVVA